MKMSSERVINAQNFWNAFIDEWRSSTTESSDFNPFHNRKRWTHYMLGPEGFLFKVMKRLEPVAGPLHYRTEWYSVDALYVGGKDLFKTNYMYPSSVKVLIEHEFGADLEEEMWKLIQWRAPLKVIIAYDWSESEKKREVHRNWAKSKLTKLLTMLDDVNGIFAENPETEYLFIMAGRHESDGPLIWQAVSNKSFQKDKIEGLPSLT